MSDSARRTTPDALQPIHASQTAVDLLVGMARSPTTLPGWRSILSAHAPTPGRIVLAALACATLYAALVSLPPMLLLADLRWLGNEVGERSLLELTQSVLLATIVFAFVWLGWRSPSDRRFAVLAAGLFACMLIRENDALLDGIGDGVWQGMVAGVASACLVHAMHDWRGTLCGMARLLVSRAGVGMLTGLVVVLVYSRLLGMGLLWQGLLDAQYMKLFKNAIEESAELLGYVLILAASMTYVGGRLVGQRRAKSVLVPNTKE
ncbi:hypothetical protein [Acidovorax sp. SDU_ACID1]|uniref:hypothetical protein n=1 Tax=Acidovorax sp. SDU_ACID1 TaxID=3136632 RepID=UPI0038739A73